MPPVASVDLALALKKRARRRLVGAIALVLLMLIILPNVLQDRAATPPSEPIKLTMPETALSPENVEQNAGGEVVAPESLPAQINPELNEDAMTPVAPVTVQSAETKTVESKNGASESQQSKEETDTRAVEPKPVAPKPVSPPQIKEAQAKKTSDDKKLTSVNVEIKKTTQAETSRYLIQVGVYSDPENVKQLQSKISAVGFTSRATKLDTAKGEKIRLRVGTFVTREAAADALKKLQANGLPGMVMIDD